MGDRSQEDGKSIESRENRLRSGENKKALKTSVSKASRLLWALTHFRNYHLFLQCFLKLSILF